MKLETELETPKVKARQKWPCPVCGEKMVYPIATVERARKLLESQRGTFVSVEVFVKELARAYISSKKK